MIGDIARCLPRANLKSCRMEMGSSGLPRLSCLSILDQQAIVPGHGSEEIQKLSELGGGRISSRDGDC